MLLPILTAGLVQAATATQPAGCAPIPKACDLAYAGISVQAGRVVDTVTVTWRLYPVTHFLQVAIQCKPFDIWDPYGRTLSTPDIPGSGEDPDSPADRPGRVTVSSPCVEGSYRTWVHAGGKGPVNGAVFGTYLPAPRVIQLERPPSRLARGPAH